MINEDEIPMNSDKSAIKIKIIAFYLVLLVVIVFSFPSVQRFVDTKLSPSDNVSSCYSSIITSDYIIYFAIAFAVTAIPAMILYSIFIYKKFGVFITKFHGEFSAELHFKEFISLNILNKVFGVSTFIIWIGACCFIFFNIAALLRCYLLE
jgi:hypothetical protein